MKQEVDALVNAHPQFRLAQFEDILTEVLAHWGSLDGLRGIDVLELGPNTRVDHGGRLFRRANVLCNLVEFWDFRPKDSQQARHRSSRVVIGRTISLGEDFQRRNDST